MTFDITGASWNWTQSDGTSGAILEPPNVLLAEPDFLELWLTGEARQFHPLLAWFAYPGNVAPMTLARVPIGLVPQHKRLVLERPLVRLGLEHQLSIIYRKAGRAEYAFVVTRATIDFDDNDLEVARHVQLLRPAVSTSSVPRPPADPGRRLTQRRNRPGSERT